MPVALFVGRFQPLHLGHLFALKKLFERFDRIVIGIGSVQESNTSRNPFSFEERKEMLERTLRGYEGRYEILGLPDFLDDAEWRDYCLRRASFDVVVGSEWVGRCFQGVKPFLRPRKLRPKLYNGTRIRELIASGKEWEHLVPREVVSYLKEMGGEERVRRLFGR
jgi:nicotinamide-nucleotide adenylyltransferase